MTFGSGAFSFSAAQTITDPTKLFSLPLCWGFLKEQAGQPRERLRPLSRAGRAQPPLQSPPLHCWSLSHWLPHWPQLFSSLLRSTHDPSHFVREGEQAHWPD